MAKYITLLSADIFIYSNLNLKYSDQCARQELVNKVHSEKYSYNQENRRKIDDTKYNV